jgi:hypothetical protein
MVVSKEKAVKLTRFDKAFLECVGNGNSDCVAIAEQFNVAEQEVLERAEQLQKKKLIFFDSEKKEAKLSLKGFNSINPSKKTLEEKKPQTPEPPIQVSQSTVQQIPEIPLKSSESQELPPVSSEVLVEKVPETKPVKRKRQPRKSKEGAKAEPGQLTIRESAPQAGDFDAIEILQMESKKAEAMRAVEKQSKTKPSPVYSILEKQATNQQQQKTAQQQPSPSTNAPQTQQGNGEKCALCRAEFSYSPSEQDKLKHGHCFCGAPYHKDCYESILNSDGLCINCGKRLSITLDRQSEEAVRGIKSVFD